MPELVGTTTKRQIDKLRIYNDFYLLMFLMFLAEI